MNQIHLLGRLTADTELKRTPSGVPYCRFRIAVKRKFAKENDIKADFFNVVAWNKQAEIVNSSFKKGEPIIVHGEVRNSDYTDKKGIKHYGVEILANSIEFSLSAKSPPEQNTGYTESPPMAAEEYPPEEYPY